jgi:hypothetical protein
VFEINRSSLPRHYQRKNLTGSGEQSSDAASVGPPDVLVKLELQPHVELRLQQPRDDIDGKDAVEHGAEQHLEAAVERVASDDVGRPVEVSPGSEDELDLVRGHFCRFTSPQFFSQTPS